MAYVHQGKLPRTVEDDGLADDFDRHAKIALLYVDEAAAGTILVCLAPESLPCDYARHPGFVEATMGHGSFITGSRMAVQPAYQGRGYFGCFTM
jgi:hypothetical protein